MKGKLFNKLILALFGISSAFATTSETTAQRKLSEIKAKPIPAGYNFPTPRTEIFKWIKESDTTAMRRHAWDIWAGATADSGEFYEGQQLPIFETWYGFSDVFPRAHENVSSKAASAFLASHRGPLRAFVEPHQFTHVKTGFSPRRLLGPEKERLMSFNKFSPHAATFIISPQTGPNGETYYYNSGPSLARLNKAWSTSTSSQERGINQFPVETLIAKPVFGVVKATGLTPLPLWQGIENSTDPVNPMPNTWKTCVLIDPQGEGNEIRNATESEIASAHKSDWLACKTYLYGSLSTLYSFKLSANEAATFNKARNGNVNTNDYAVLLALHITTRETPMWTWHTYYWQPGQKNTEDNFPGSKADQPKELKAPWNNYAMCATYYQTTTIGGNKMDVCFNPYLETTPGIPAGITSNCMSCHGVARFSEKPNEGNPYPMDYKAPIAFFTDPYYFDSSTTHTEFSWAIAGRATFAPENSK